MVFNICFSLSFHRPYTGTCTLCDTLTNRIETVDQHDSANANIPKEVHLRKAEMPRKSKDTAKIEANSSPNKVAICFDLQKTLQIPLLINSKLYYLRQLWKYYFAIHDLAKGSAQMFM